MERVVFLDRGTVRGPLRRPNFPHDWVDYDATPAHEVVPRLKGATIAVTNKVKILRSAIDQLRDLRFIAVTATGYDCVDMAACRERGIAVSNVPGYAQDSVAEHVFMLVLALRRRLMSLARAVEAGAWQRSAHFALLEYPLQDLRGATLGLIGYGDIARHVERLGKAFGMEVLVAEHKGAASIRPGRRAFQEVLRDADIVSLHAPRTPQTLGLIGAPDLAIMKPSAILINTARGGLVDETALAQALRSGRLGGAGIDVLTEEPPVNGNVLINERLPNLIVTPHVAWASDQAVAAMSEVVIKNLEAFVAGRPQNVVA